MPDIYIGTDWIYDEENLDEEFHFYIRKNGTKAWQVKYTVSKEEYAKLKHLEATNSKEFETELEKIYEEQMTKKKGENNFTMYKMINLIKECDTYYVNEIAPKKKTK